jgi:hypothetical protein
MGSGRTTKKSSPIIAKISGTVSSLGISERVPLSESAAADYQLPREACRIYEWTTDIFEADVRMKPKSKKRASVGTTETTGTSKANNNSSSEWVTEGAGSDRGDGATDNNGSGDDSSSQGERRTGWMKRRRERSFLNARLQRGMHELKPVRTFHW